MQASQVPIKIPTVWAASAPAGTGVITVPIPSQIGITPNAASWTDGFPPQTAQAGGYPRVEDMNGGLQEISAWARWQAAGGPIYWDFTFNGNVGGYPAGSVLAAVATIGNFWISTVDNNTSNPDTGGANWLSASILPPSGRLLNTQIFTVGTSTYTPTSGTNAVEVWVQAGGGAGGGNYAAPTGYVGAGGGGSGGAFGKGRYTSSFSGLTVTVGAGGTGATGAANGGNGGASSFGSLLSCPGGIGGAQGSGNATSVAFAVSGLGSLPSGSVTGANLFSMLGQEAWDGLTFGTSGYGGQGGNSHLGMGGGNCGINQSGHAPSGHGAGSGGACSGNGYGAVNTPNGGVGLIIVYEYS